MQSQHARRPKPPIVGQSTPRPIRNGHLMCFDCIRNKHADCKGHCSCICWREAGLLMHFHAAQVEDGSPRIGAYE